MIDFDPVDDLDAFEALKAANLGHLLLKAGRRTDEVGLARVRALSGATALRPAHMRLFPHISLEGTRATEIADQLGISKQAVGQLVGDLVGLGMVERVRDPTDGRARLVRFTAEGRHAIVQGLGVLAGIEADVAHALGSKRVARLKADLAAVLAVLDALDAAS